MTFRAICRLPHLKGHVCALGRNNALKTVSAGLPNVLHGTNGKMIRNHIELCRALDQLRGLLYSIVEAGDIFTGINRLDLALNFPLEPGEVLNSYRGVKVFGLHADPKTFQNGDATAFVSSPQTLEWRGSEFWFCMYDKSTQMASANGFAKPDSRCTRVEIRLLNNRRVTRFLGREKGQMDNLDFLDLYRRFRELLRALPVGIAPGSGSLNDQVAAACLQQGTLVDGIPIPELFKARLHPVTYRRRMKAIANIAAGRLKLHWADILPELGPPEVVDVLDDGSLASVFDPSWGTPRRIVRTEDGYTLVDMIGESQEVARSL